MAETRASKHARGSTPGCLVDRAEAPLELVAAGCAGPRTVVAVDQPLHDHDGLAEPVRDGGGGVASPLQRARDHAIGGDRGEGIGERVGLALPDGVERFVEAAAQESRGVEAGAAVAEQVQDGHVVGVSPYGRSVSCSMATRRLYLATRSPRAGAPDFS